MKNLDELIKNLNKGEKYKYISFFDPYGVYGWFSQWYFSKFTVDGITYKTAEHWMMAEKARLFNDKEIEEQILIANRPGIVQTLGKEVQNFDSSIWRDHRFNIVVKGNFEKFSQKDELRKILLDTGKSVLVEASPYDKIWGIGLEMGHPLITNPYKWNGLNLLGFALMEVRKQLSG